MKKLTLFFIVSSVLFLFAAFFATWLNWYSQVDYQSHYQRTELVRNIQDNVAQLTHEILLVQKGQTRNYDRVAQLLNNNEQLMFLLINNRENNLDELNNAWQVFKQNIEDIKSEYALYQNSLRYLPQAIEQLLAEFFYQEKYKQQANILLNLERRVMRFSLGHSVQSLEQLNKQLSRFDQMAEKLPAETRAKVLMLSKHVQVIINNYQLIHQHHNQLLNTQIPLQIQARLKQYNQSFQQTVNQAKEIRLIFYVVCLLLILIVIMVAAKLKMILSELHENEALLRQVTDNAPGMLWMSDQNGRLIFVNDLCRQAGVFAEGNVVHSMALDKVYDKDRKNLQSIFQQQKHQKEVTAFQFRILQDEKESLYWAANLVARFSDEGEYLGLICSTIDITQQKLLEQKLRLAAQVFENNLEGILISNAKNEIMQVNRAFSELTGYSQDEVLGKNPNILNSKKQSVEFYQNMWQALNNEGLWQGELYNRRKNGEVYPEWLTIIAVKNEFQEITNYIAIFSDITEKKKAEEDIHFLAHYDPLTELPNRVLFYERVEHALQHAARLESCIVIMFLDLDRFKTVNDSLGHEAGDDLLREVAQDLSSCLREEDTVARLGGDEFIILLDTLEKEHINKDCPIIAEKIIQKLSRDYWIKGSQVFIGASIGISIFPEDGQSLDILIQRADMAMYHAKDKGRNNFQFYSDKLNEAIQSRLNIEADLRIAIEEKQFFLNYQPQYNLLRNEIEGFEALIRWQHPIIGLVPPDYFISIAEEMGLIVKIGEWVLETATEQLIAWQKISKIPLRMAINVSLKQLETNDFVDCIKQVIVRSNISPQRLEFEVTESMFLQEGSKTLQALKLLDQIGVQISMDDFGTGYSNMSYLKKMPIDRIKIDRCFVTDIPHDENDAAIVCAIIDIARHFDIKVIAEGIEFQEQADYLISKGCDEGQGFLYSQPISTEEVESLLLGVRLHD